jgi:hypothetical protein
VRRNSGSSSRKRTPWLARLTSPGGGDDGRPPPGPPAADEAGIGDGVMRRAEGAAGKEGPAGGQEVGGGVELGGFQRLLFPWQYGFTSSVSSTIRGVRVEVITRFGTRTTWRS